ncbi:MAG: hypothetical protein KAY37_18100, partial [Phycisphaerae bacterium]|nr:hypothetical protein [Phycisphaerae bacterium]
HRQDAGATSSRDYAVQWAPTAQVARHASKEAETSHNATATYLPQVNSVELNVGWSGPVDIAPPLTLQRQG